LPENWGWLTFRSARARWATNGYSRELCGFMGAVDPAGPSHVAKTADNVLTYVHRAVAFGLRGVAPGPAAIWLFVDADEGPSAGPDNRPLVPPARIDHPDKWDNHYGDGYHDVSCDGHADWVRGKEVVRRLELSEDIGRSERVRRLAAQVRLWTSSGGWTSRHSAGGRTWPGLWRRWAGRTGGPAGS
jgi:hypothetical protein